MTTSVNKGRRATDLGVLWGGSQSKNIDIVFLATSEDLAPESTIDIEARVVLLRGWPRNVSISENTVGLIPLAVFGRQAASDLVRWGFLEMTCANNENEPILGCVRRKVIRVTEWWYLIFVFPQKGDMKCGTWDVRVGFSNHSRGENRGWDIGQWTIAEGGGSPDGIQLDIDSGTSTSQEDQSMLWEEPEMTVGGTWEKQWTETLEEKWAYIQECIQGWKKEGQQEKDELFIETHFGRKPESADIGERVAEQETKETVEAQQEEEEDEEDQEKDGEKEGEKEEEEKLQEKGEERKESVEIIELSDSSEEEEEEEEEEVEEDDEKDEDYDVEEKEVPKKKKGRGKEKKVKEVAKEKKVKEVAKGNEDEKKDGLDEVENCLWCRFLALEGEGDDDDELDLLVCGVKRARPDSSKPKAKRPRQEKVEYEYIPHVLGYVHWKSQKTPKAVYCDAAGPFYVENGHRVAYRRSLVLRRTMDPESEAVDVLPFAVQQNLRRPMGDHQYRALIRGASTPAIADHPTLNISQDPEKDRLPLERGYVHFPGKDLKPEPVYWDGSDFYFTMNEEYTRLRSHHEVHVTQHPSSAVIHPVGVANVKDIDPTVSIARTLAKVTKKPTRSS